MIASEPSLKRRLGLAVVVLGLVAALAAGLVVVGMARVSDRLDAALAAEARIEGYRVLSNQVGRYLVVATEAVQSGLAPEARTERLDGIAVGIEASFVRVRGDLERSVEAVSRLGLTAQSQRATTSLAIARMEAQVTAIRRALAQDRPREVLKGHIDSFAIGFDGPLNEAISSELRVRNDILGGIAGLRQRLTVWGYALGGIAVLLGLGAYPLLIRPQFRRLDLMRPVTERIAAQDFDVTLPEDPHDEIGRLFAEMNRMVGALAQRKAEIGAEWSRLNETIAARTAALSEANIELARRDRDRRRFFADISHELRTPLTVILLEAQLGQGEPDPEVAASFATIHTRAERLKRRIDDLLRVARSESGQLELDTAPFALAEVVGEALAETEAEIASAGMRLERGGVPEVTCQGDANWQRQILTELMRNAIRHARAGGVVAVAAEVSGGLARVCVTDHGPGVPPCAPVFERFAQGTSPAKSEGFGIGLALAAWVAEAQGGRVTIESPRPDAPEDGAPGTRVTLSIPLSIGTL